MTELESRIYHAIGRLSVYVDPIPSQANYPSHVRECAEIVTGVLKESVVEINRLRPNNNRIAAAEKLAEVVKSRHPVFLRGCDECEALAAFRAASEEGE